MVFNFLGPIFLFLISIQNALLMFDCFGSLQRLLSVYVCAQYQLFLQYFLQGLVVVHAIQIASFVECFLFGALDESFRAAANTFSQGVSTYLSAIIITYLCSIPASLYTLFVYLVRGTTDDPIRKWVSHQLA